MDQIEHMEPFRTSPTMRKMLEPVVYRGQREMEGQEEEGRDAVAVSDLIVASDGSIGTAGVDSGFHWMETHAKDSAPSGRHRLLVIQLRISKAEEFDGPIFASQAQNSCTFTDGHGPDCPAIGIANILQSKRRVVHLPRLESEMIQDNSHLKDKSLQRCSKQATSFLIDLRED